MAARLRPTSNPLYMEPVEEQERLRADLKRRLPVMFVHSACPIGSGW